MVLNKNVVCSCGNSSQHTSSNPGYGGKGPFAVGRGLGPPWAECGKSSWCSGLTVLTAPLQAQHSQRTARSCVGEQRVSHSKGMRQGPRCSCHGCTGGAFL